MRRNFLPLVIMLVATLAAPAAAHAATPLAPDLSAPSLDSTPSSESSATRLAQAGSSIVAISSGGERLGSGVVIAPNTVLTSLNILKGRKLNPASAAIWYNGNFVGFKLISTDDKLKLALLSADLPGAKPAPWGKGGNLRKGDKVIALGMPEAIRDVIRVPGEVKAPALAMMGPVLTTDIPIDPLLEGGALVTPDGRIAGIIVSQGFGLVSTEQRLGVAVTAEAARELYDDITQSAADEKAAAAARARQKWLARGVLILIVGVFVGFFWWFGRWYRRMAAREEAEEIAAQTAAVGEAAES